MPLPRPSAPFRPALLLLALGSAGLIAQTPAPSPAALSAPQEPIAAQIQQLSAALEKTRAQLQQYQTEVERLQAQLRQLQAGQSAAPADAALARRVGTLEDQQAITQGKVDDQYQSKVESGSRFHVTLSGLLLMNLYANSGAVENSDVPNLALPAAAGATGGDLGATLRQSEISLRVAGPEIWGAKASADLFADFYGGFPNSLDGTASGLARLKVARGRLDWDRTSLVFGLDVPLISPLSPTSYASLGTPALAYSGNLWTWTPQISLEHRWALNSIWRNTLQAGVMDPLSGQFPVRTGSRVPEAGESSRRPALVARDALGRDLFGRDFTLGAGAYASRQDYGFGRSVPAWAVTADWNLAVASWLDVSGEFYRGRAIGGLWGAIGDSVVESGPQTAATSQIAGLNAAGGWTQLKFHLASTLELNTTYGEDNPFSADLRRFAASSASDPLARNQTALINLIDRPRSDLVFALEYRRLITTPLSSSAQTAGHVNAAIGVIF